VAQAVSGASAPYLAEQIHKLTTDVNGKVNTEANLMAHAVLGAVTSYAANNSALAGASGAAMGEYIAQQLYPGVKRNDLSEEQRQTISALGMLAAGLAGGVVGDSTADVMAGAQAGKNALENNNLALVARGCAALSPCRNKVAEQLLEIGAKAGITGLAGLAIKDVADKMTSDELEHFVTLQMMGNDEITGRYLSSLQDKYGSDSDPAPNVGANLTDVEKAELGGAGSGTPGGWEPQDEENARNNASSVTPSRTQLNQAASSPNRNGLTDAGRALQKHGGREGSAYTYSSQKASVLNQEAQTIVNEILSNPNTKIENRIIFENKQRITVVEATAPDGRALRFTSDGSKLIGFREPPTK